MLVLLGSLAAAPAQADRIVYDAEPERSAVVAFVPRASLEDMAALPRASAGLMGATQGRYRSAQAYLDISQGARTSLAAYEPKEPPPLALAPGEVHGWPAVVQRARAAPADVVPGLFAGSVPAGAALVGRPSLGAALVAADRRGRFAEAATVSDALERRRLVVVAVSGMSELRALAGALGPETLLVAVADAPAAIRAQLLPIAVVGLGKGRMVSSATTRAEGLVAAIDIAPTVLEWLRLPVAADMTGQGARLEGAFDPAMLREQTARLRVVGERRMPTLYVLALAWMVLAGVLRLAAGREGGRRGARIGGLAVMWVLPLLLVTAALAPSRTAEQLGVAVGALVLGALTDTVVRWPRAPMVPGLVAVVAYVVDLAFGSELIVRSLLGPNPLYGSRFYGIGNELEATLAVLLLVGTAGALGARERSRAAAAAFAGGGLLLGVAVGAGRLGADVGGVITIGAGAGLATVLALPGPITRRRLAIAAAVPVVGLAVLAALDLATGGDGHFTRTVLRADDSSALGDVVSRRLKLASNSLRAGLMPLLAPLCLALIYLAFRRREALLGDVPGAGVWQAALAGSAAAGIAGALSNDSGPLLLLFATFMAGWALAYVASRPDPVPSTPTR